jgi:hypothetical protein
MECLQKLSDRQTCRSGSCVERVLGRKDGPPGPGKRCESVGGGGVEVRDSGPQHEPNTAEQGDRLGAEHGVADPKSTDKSGQRSFGGGAGEECRAEIGSEAIAEGGDTEIGLEAAAPAVGADGDRPAMLWDRDVQLANVAG